MKSRQASNTAKVIAALLDDDNATLVIMEGLLISAL